MPRPQPRRKLAEVKAIALFALLGACSSDSLSERPPKAFTLVLQPLGLTSVSALPDRDVELKVVALRTAGVNIETAQDLQPVPDAPVTWSFVGFPPDGGMVENLSATDGIGVASSRTFVGPNGGRAIQVQASTPGAPAVTFTIDVLDPTLRLEVLSANPTLAAVNQEERIRVRLVREVGNQRSPVTGTTVTASLLDGPFFSGAQILEGDGADAILLTDDNGLASVTFATGNTAQTSYTLRFCGNASCPGVPPADVTVNVTPRGGGGSNCGVLSDCAPPLVCVGGQCTSPQPFCRDNDDCPPGYICSGDQCILPCGPSNPCPAQFNCVNQRCEPDVPPGPALDVRGRWLTAYHFDISDTLPSFLGDGFKPVVDFLSLVFWSQYTIDIPIVGAVLEGLLDGLVEQYVPSYVPDVVAALRDLIYVFENIEVRGEMELAQSPTTPYLGGIVNGTEVWTSAVITVPSLCAGGPAEFQQNPACAQVNVALESVLMVQYSNNSPTVGTVVEPFSGGVIDDRLYLYGRDVSLASRQLVNVVLDLMVSVASGGGFFNFEQFLFESIPCADLQLAFDDLACDVTGGSVCSLSGVEAACRLGSGLATQALSTELGQIPVAFDMVFDATAQITDRPFGGATDILGNPDNPSDLGASSLLGGTEVNFLGGDLDGSSYWWAVRPGVGR
ncbi:MAG: hypothetical protein AAFU77_03720 [Myxococcota bacterium]